MLCFISPLSQTATENECFAFCDANSMSTATSFVRNILENKNISNQGKDDEYFLSFFFKFQKATVFKTRKIRNFSEGT